MSPSPRLEEAPPLAGRDASPPPRPRSEQLASLERRISSGTPRRLSGGFGPDRRPGHQLDDGPSRLATSMPDFDRPLIVSTPDGIAGALDAPPPPRPILAPVPRHQARLNALTDDSSRTMSRLETIPSAPSEAETRTRGDGPSPRPSLAEGERAVLMEDATRAKRKLPVSLGRIAVPAVVRRRSRSSGDKSCRLM